MCGMRYSGDEWYAFRGDAAMGHRGGQVVGEGSSMRKSRLTVVVCACSALTLAFASSAWAHVEVSPGQIPAGGTETLTVEVPTEKEVPTTEIRLELPEGFEVSGAEAP